MDSDLHAGLITAVMHVTMSKSSSHTHVSHLRLYSPSALHHENSLTMGFPTTSSTTTSSWTTLTQQRWKGKQRAIDVGLDGRDEATGALVPLTLVGNGVYDA